MKRGGRDPRCLRLFAGAACWGVTTGALTGAVIGALVVLVTGLRGSRPPGWLFGLAVAGALYGALASLIPSVLGAFVVTGLIRRHPHPAYEQAVRTDLRRTLGSIVALLDAAVLTALIAGGASLSAIATSISFMLAADACMVLVLCRAQESMARILVAAPERRA